MDIINELKHKSLLDYVESSTNQKSFKAGSNTYRFKKCPICGTGDHFNINTDKNLFNTFGNCGGGTVIDFYVNYYGVSKSDAIKGLCKDFNIIDVDRKEYKKVVNPIPTKPTKVYKEIDLTTLINSYYTSNNCDYLYFVERLLNFEFDDAAITENFDKLFKNRFLVGDPKEIFKDNLNLLPGLNNISSYEYIFPIWENGKVVNCILRRNDKKNTDNCKTLNLKGLDVKFFNTDYLNQPEGLLFITEGIFDCLSIECLGYKSICLNSVNMANKFIDLVKENIIALKDTTFILALDNDEHGQKATKRISEGLDSLNIKNFSLTVRYKDINEYYLNDLEGLKEEIESCTRNKNSALYFLDNAFYNSVDKYLNYQKKSTGFELLDEYFNGLMPALYLIGAVSSIGKTTFMVQIADNIAKSGNDVLYFSLEQSKFELISKSLSRTAHVELDEEVTAKHIMYNLDSELTAKCIDLYKSTAERLFIHEGNFNTTVREIESIINSHISLTGNKPVVIIDYLQVIKSENVGMSDKSMVDDMVTMLKRISRNLFIPIFVISSLNRANYLNPISFESFKESGSIEYTADTLLGLQYTKVHEIQELGEKRLSQKRLEMRKAIDGDPLDNYRRDIELVALKNRHGGQQFSIEYSFYPRQNYFKEKEILKRFEL